MEIYLDTANIDEITKFVKLGLIDGVTTNPALISLEHNEFKENITRICNLVNGPVSVEVISRGLQQIIDEAVVLSNFNKNIVIKLPAIPEGFEALNILSKKGIKTNLTIVYTANQALLAAKLGATYVSPFIGRLDSTSTGGIELIEEILQIYKNFRFQTKIIAASMRNEIYVKKAAISGSHIATIPPEVLLTMMKSELTDVSLNGFLKDWDSANKNEEYFNFIKNI